MKTKTAAQVRAALAKRINGSTTQHDLAKELGVSDTYISEVLRGNREPAGKLLAALGLRRVMLYAEVGQ